MSFLGPGYLVAVGYMDPGNWATSLAGGSKFGYALLTVALLSNLMAILLQALCARLGIGAGRDLAQACRDAFPRAVSWPLWLLAEIAICATDLAEVIGTAIGLNLLFGIPLEIGVLITALDVFIILWMQNLGFRWIEAFVVTLLGVIAVCFAIQIAMADPQWGAVIRGFAPTTEIVTNPEMLYLALGILGATVMPHNLYLHSGVVQTRRFGDSVADRREAISLATVDSTIALMFALLINASILILAAATFNKAGKTDVAELDQVYSFLAPMLGSAIAPTLFGIALLCCGLNSTVTATLSGQIVMEGFLDIRLPGWARRLITRVDRHRAGGGGHDLVRRQGHARELLILSQVVLSLQLPFAIVPLVMFTADRRKMGELVAPRWVTVLAALTAAIIIALNIKLLCGFGSGAEGEASRRVAVVLRAVGRWPSGTRALSGWVAGIGRLGAADAPLVRKAPVASAAPAVRLERRSMSAAMSATARGSTETRCPIPRRPMAPSTFGSLYGGVQAGYNFVFPSGLLLGVEADISFPEFFEDGADDRGAPTTLGTGHHRPGSTMSRRSAAASATSSAAPWSTAPAASPRRRRASSKAPASSGPTRTSCCASASAGPPAPAPSSRSHRTGARGSNISTTASDWRVGPAAVRAPLRRRASTCTLCGSA